MLTYVIAGHPGPFLLRASGAIEGINGKPEVPLGVLAAAAYHDRTIGLLPNDAVFVFSDGVVEAMNGTKELYGGERLKADLRTAVGLAPEEIVQSVKRQVDAFTGNAPKADDVTMLALRWWPARSWS